MQSLNDFKRGDTFSLSCTYKEAGVAKDVSGLVIKSQIRNPLIMDLVADLTIVIADQTTNIGQFTLMASASMTQTWPLGKLVCDLQISENEIVRSSDSFYVPVIQDVTQ